MFSMTKDQIKSNLKVIRLSCEALLPFKAILEQLQEQTFKPWI